MQRILNRMGWGVAAALAIALLGALAGVIFAGPLDPPAGITTSTSTQEQLIFQPSGACPAGFPITISTPGSYKLAQNITGCGGNVDGIQISASNVSLDLNGFSLIGVAGSGTGVKAAVAIAKVSLSNGKVTGWGGDGVGFFFPTVSASQLTHLIVSNNGGNGIILGDGSTLTDCVLRSNSFTGVAVYGTGSVVSGCDATSNGTSGVYATGPNSRVIGNHAVANARGYSISNAVGVVSQDIEGNSAMNNTVAGFDVSFASGVTLSKNSARNNNGGGANNYVGSGTCAGCDIGPIGTAAAGTSPWANISD